jgi:hypothetical protein
LLPVARQDFSSLKTAIDLTTVRLPVTSFSKLPDSTFHILITLPAQDANLPSSNKTMQSTFSFKI